MTLLIIISGILLIFIGILFLPIRLVVDSERKRYFIEQGLFFKLQLVPNTDLFFIRFRLLFISFKINPFKIQKTKKKTSKPNTLKIKESKSALGFKQVVSLIKVFKIKKAYANIDTGDFPLNAQLYPVSQTVNGQNINLQINFENENTIDLEIFTQLYKLMWIAIKHKLITNN